VNLAVEEEQQVLVNWRLATGLFPSLKDAVNVA